MDTTRTIGGADLVESSANLQWYEAVAVVQQLAETIRAAGSIVVPDLPHLAVSSDGTVAILPGAPGGDRPAAQLTELLRLLLQHAAVPGEIAKAVAQAGEQQSADQDIGRVIESLHYFERPDRPAVLRTMVERVAAAVAEANVARNLEAVVAKVREAATAPPPKEPKAEPQKPRQRRRTAVLVAFAAVVVLIAGATIALWRFGSPASGPAGIVSSVVARASQRVTQAVDSTVDRLFGVAATKEAPSASASEPVPAPKPASHAHKKKTREIVTAQSRSVAALPPTVPLDLPGLIPPSALEPAPSDDPLVTDRVVVRAGPEVNRVYGRQDFGVTPPVPLQPALGRVTMDVTGMAGDMDVVVDETGHVERVTLLRPNRYQDRWLIYAIKAREFRPANVDGRPVKYVLRMRTGL